MGGMDYLHEFDIGATIAGYVLARRNVFVTCDCTTSSPGTMLLYAGELPYGGLSGEPVLACACQE